MLVDTRNYEKLNQHKWSAMVHYSDGGHVENIYAVRWEVVRYARDKNGRKTRGYKRVFIYAHREIAEAGSGLVVDHKNGLGLDNREENLYDATYSENGSNTMFRSRTVNFDLPRGVEPIFKRKCIND